MFNWFAKYFRKEIVVRQNGVPLLEQKYEDGKELPNFAGSYKGQVSVAFIAQEKLYYLAEALAKKAVSKGIKAVAIKRDTALEAIQEARVSSRDCVISIHQGSCSYVLAKVNADDMAFAHDLAFSLSLGVKAVSRDARGSVFLHSFPEGVSCALHAEDIHDEEALIDGIRIWAKKLDLL